MKKIYQNTEKKEYVTPKVVLYANSFATRILAGSGEEDELEEGDMSAKQGGKIFESFDEDE